MQWDQEWIACPHVQKRQSSGELRHGSNIIVPKPLSRGFKGRQEHPYLVSSEKLHLQVRLEVGVQVAGPA